MNRHIKKTNDFARCLFLANNITSIERGYLAGYFQEYPADYRRVRKIIGSHEKLAILRKDVAENYRHPGYTEEGMKTVRDRLRHGCFLPYLALDFVSRVFISLNEIGSIKEL